MIDLILSKGADVAMIVLCFLFMWIKFNDLKHIEQELRQNSDQHREIYKVLYEIKGRLTEHDTWERSRKE